MKTLLVALLLFSIEKAIPGPRPIEHFSYYSYGAAIQADYIEREQKKAAMRKIGWSTIRIVFRGR